MTDAERYEAYVYAQVLADVNDHLVDVAHLLGYEPLTDARLDELTHMVAEYVAAVGTVRGDS